MTESEQPDQPTGQRLLRVVRGNPDDSELAALTAVVATAAAGGGEPEHGPRRSHWADRAALLRGPLYPGAGAWRASGFPR